MPIQIATCINCGKEFYRKGNVFDFFCTSKCAHNWTKGD